MISRAVSQCFVSGLLDTIRGICLVRFSTRKAFTFGLTRFSSLSGPASLASNSGGSGGSTGTGGSRHSDGDSMNT